MKLTPNDWLECEGHVLKTFFESFKLFNEKQSLVSIRKTSQIELSLKKHADNYFNMVHISAHGFYKHNTKTHLDYSYIVQRRGNKDIEIFRPDSIVRTGLKADIILSKNCQTFNPVFIDVIKNYKGVSNFIAPVNSPYIGNTLVFSMMFYNLLLRTIRKNTVRISDENIIASFKLAKLAYSKYNSREDYRLYNRASNKVFK